MSQQLSSYRQLFKATSIFGGVQVINIIVSIIRSKFVAILLGPAGMGLFGLFSSTLGLIGGLIGFGLNTSAVRDIARAYEMGDKQRIGKVAAVVKKLVWFTGVAGMVLCFLGAPWLSKFTFGDSNYTFAFYWLSVSILFNQLAVEKVVILQGTRQLKYLAKANVIGSVAGLLVSIPVYYFYGKAGIVPSIIFSSFSAFCIAWYFSRKVNIEIIKVNLNTIWIEGKTMVGMGFLINLSIYFVAIESYIIRIFISNTGSINDVGLYNAGFSIIGTYVGMVFTAMATDFYPRLSGVASDNIKVRGLVNQQAEIALLILGPVLAIFLIFIDWVVIILYSKQFLAISAMVHWATLGIFFKAASWSIAFIFLAKGAGKIFFLNEFFAVIVVGLCNILGYKLGGLTGLGISFLVAYVIYFLQVLIIVVRKYNFSFHPSFLKIFGIQMLLVLTCFFIANFVPSTGKYISGSLVIGFSVLYSFRELNTRMQLLAFIKSKVWRN